MSSSIPALRCARALAFVLLAFSSGCGPADEPLPKTHPVTGTLTWDDGQPVSGGMIMFQSLGDTSVTMTGEISPDGHYSLATTRNAQRQAGSIAGEHRVTVMPNVEAASQTQPPIVLAKTVTVADGENTIDLQLPARQRVGTR